MCRITVFPSQRPPADPPPGPLVVVLSWSLCLEGALSTRMEAPPPTPSGAAGTHNGMSTSSLRSRGASGLRGYVRPGVVETQAEGLVPT